MDFYYTLESHKRTKAYPKVLKRLDKDRNKRAGLTFFLPPFLFQFLIRRQMKFNQREKKKIANRTTGPNKIR